MNIDKYLEEILKIDSKIANKLYEREMWWDISQGITSCGEGERVQASSSQDKIANAVAKYTDIDREIEELKEKKKQFINRIERLPKIYYEVMHDTYIKFMSQEQIRVKNNKKSTSWVSTTLKRAKLKLQAEIEGEEDV